MTTNGQAGEADDAPQNGQRHVIRGRDHIFYDGYWIQYYCPPPDTLAARKQLIAGLTRRLFHHTENGINTPGERLETAREAYEKCADPARKRVNGAMLAGAIFNRASDIFTAVVELAERGVQISPNNDLMRQCSEYFVEALELGKSVRHYSGEEGIDELWGEPFKAFTMSPRDFYTSRYIKIAQTMRDIDRVAQVLGETLANDPGFDGVEERIERLAVAARQEAETMRSDPVIFEVWPIFVAEVEHLLAFEPVVAPLATAAHEQLIADGKRLIQEGVKLIQYLAGARVSMPKTTKAYLLKCGEFARKYPRIDARSPKPGAHPPQSQSSPPSATNATP